MRRMPVHLHRNAGRLRRNLTEAEKTLWYHLRGKRLGGIKFKRQVPIPPYIVDFCAEHRRLVVEIDGGGHGTPSQRQYDGRREAFLVRKGYRVVRIWNNDALGNLDSVLQTILDAAEQT